MYKSYQTQLMYISYSIQPATIKKNKTYIKER
jgi:hypothetical protein